jgi:rubrerythrin
MKTELNSALVSRLEPELETFLTRADEIRWSPAQIPYDQIDWNKITMADLFAVFVTLHIENYSDVYTKLLIDSYKDVPLIQKFILNWEREEENHARVLERYMMTLGIPLEELRANYAMVDKSDFPVPSRNQSGLNVFVFFQELLTREMYTKILKSAREPVLVNILKRVVRDEERHYRFYKMALGKRFELDRKDTLKQFGRIVRVFGMPQTMFRQKGMTDKLMEYYRFELDEINSIAKPVVKMLEQEPSPRLARWPRLQKLWQHRYSFLYLPQSPYLWGHVLSTVMDRLGLNIVSRSDREHVARIVARLEGLLSTRRTSSLAADETHCTPVAATL